MEQSANPIPAAQAAPPPKGFAHWGRRTAVFLTGQTVSLFGSSLVQFAIIWHITLTTQMGGIMAVATLCGFLPQVVISLFSGVWADRFNRKFLIIFADAMVAASTFILALFFLSGHDDLWMIFLVSAIRSLGAGVQTPAVSAMLPLIVPQEKLIRVGGLQNTLNSVMFLISPAAAGFILSVTSITSTFFVDIVTAAAAITIMAFLKVPLHHKAMERQKGGYFKDFKLGFRYVFRSRFLIWYFVYFAVFMFLVVPAAQLTPLMVTRTFGNDVWRLSLTEVMFSVGSVAGGVIISAWGGFKNRTRTVALAAVLFGLFTMALGVVPGFAAFQVVMVLTGVQMPLFSTPAMVLLQEQVDHDMQGRVFALVQIVMTGMMPLGMVLFGPLADRVPIQLLFVVTGVIFAGVGVSSFFNKYFARGVIDAGGRPPA